jgi:hypothetical protein
MLYATLLSVCLLGASGDVSDSFVVNIPSATVASWAQAHPDAISSAAGGSVVWRRGNIFCVQKRTPIGSVWAVLEDRLTVDAVGYRYECRLAPGRPQGGVKDYQMSVQLRSAGDNRSQLDVRAHLEVDLPRVRDRQIQARMEESARNIHRLLTSLRAP